MNASASPARASANSALAWASSSRMAAISAWNDWIISPASRWIVSRSLEVVGPRLLALLRLREASRSRALASLASRLSTP